MKRALRDFLGRLPAWLGPVFPWVLALCCLCLSWLCPLDTVSGQVLAAGLLQAPRWLLFLSPLWLVLWGLWSRRRGPLGRRYLWVLLVIPGVWLGGLPPSWTEPLDVPESSLRLVAANVNAFSDSEDPAELEERLSQLDADVIVVIEKRALQIRGMVRVADNFDDDLPRISHATAIFCREGLACLARVTPEYGSESMKMPMGLVRLPDAGVCFLGIHGPPPAPYDPTGLQPYMDWVATHIVDGRISAGWDPCEAGDRVILAGDLNAVPWSESWETLIERGLTDRLMSWGIFAASWPSGGGWPDLPFFQLDHVLIGPVEVPRAEKIRLPGSDHQAVVLDLIP